MKIGDEITLLTDKGESVKGQIVALIENIKQERIYEIHVLTKEK